jgi:hypothetical protein
MRLAPVEAERNIKNVVACSIKDSIILIVLFTRSGIDDYSIKKNHSNPVHLEFDSIETKGFGLNSSRA